MTCSTCHLSKYSEEDFYFLPLPLTDSLQNSIHLYMHQELMLNYKCMKCHNKNTSLKIPSLKTLPEYLCLTLFRCDVKGNKHNETTIIDRKIDLSKYFFDFPKSEFHYELFSMVRHLGTSSEYGHYVASHFLGDDFFYTFNDSEVSCSSTASLGQNDAYMVFYKLNKPKLYSNIPNIRCLQTTSETKIKESRFALLKQEVHFKNDSPEVTNKLDKLLLEHTDIFYLEGDKLTFCSLIEHAIPLYSDSPIINIKPYSRRSRWEKEEMEKKVQELLDLGIIETSTSPYNSPLHLVKKGTDKEGKPKTRLVVDFSKLNAITIPETYPCDQVLDILDQLKHCKYFSTLDLRKGYLQLRMKEEDKHKTAFSSGYHHFQFLRMPLGLRSSSHSFTRCMRLALANLIGKILFIFLDDIILYSSTIDEHIERLELLFNTLRIQNLKLSPDKCTLLQTEIRFLGFTISEQGVQPDSSKLAPIMNFPQPMKPKAIKSFLGMCGYYRRHVPHFSHKA